MASPLDGKTFILGIGAQKAGTTWLAEYLDSRPEVFMAPLMEMHYFDAQYVPGLRADVDALFKRKESILVRQQIWPSARRKKRLEHLRARMRMNDDAAYVSYFERYVPAECTHFGEITPEYALLPREVFENIRRYFPRIKVVYLMRDPVDRFYSQLRMNMRAGRVQDGREEELFISFLNEPRYFDKTYYHETLSIVRSVFDSDEIHIAFYEELFGDAEMSRLCDFLGLAFVPGAYDKKANAAPKPANLDPKLAALARERFAPVYDYCRAEFGERVPASWRA
ncbi:sulfotransferase [Parvibaculum sp.]|uniref:sulfotransferase n=1 Tax=Parvibaculum sp. TaxID=2024848 RepID=UPI00321038D8